MLRNAMIVSLVLVLTLSTAFAQTASYKFGPAQQGCSGNPVSFTVRGKPQLGTTITLGVTMEQNTATHFYLSLIMTGFSDKRWGAIKLPFDSRVLSFFTWTYQKYWCGLLYVSGDAFTVVPGLKRGPVYVRMPIPNNRALLGLRFYQQVLAYRRISLPVVLERFRFSRAGYGVIGT